MCARRANSESSLSLSINRIKQATPEFFHTEQYNLIFKQAKSTSTLILQCNGLPGSGKTEILLKLAELFPYTHHEQNECVKWNIQCDNFRNDVKAQFVLLVKRMRELSILSLNTDQYQEILESIEENTGRQLAEALRRCDVPILILMKFVKDAKSEEKTFLKDFLCAIAKKNEPDRTKQVHIYIASRRQTSIFEKREYLKIECYKVEPVTGFLDEEGLIFLLEEDQGSEENINAAKELCHKFSGSPLALTIAKSYCRKTIIDYTDYLKLLNDAVDDVARIENIADVKDEYGPVARKIFQAITIPIRANEDSSRDSVLLWKVVSCLSFVHHDRVPRFLIERLCQVLRRGKADNVELRNKIESGSVISALLDQGMCSQNGEGDITFNEVVTHAIRKTLKSFEDSEDIDALKVCIIAFAGLLTKETRDKSVKQKLCKLLYHGEVLLRHVEKEKKSIRGQDALLMWMLISHIYDNLGAIFLAQPMASFHRLCEIYFKRALDILWKKSSEIVSFLESLDKVLEVEEIATGIVKECVEAGEVLPNGFITQYEAIIMMSPNINFDILKNLLQKENVESLKTCLTTQSSNVELIKLLRKSEVFLSESKQRKMFFAERMVSILHSWSLVYIYSSDQAADSWSFYNRRSSLASKIAQKTSETCGIHLLSAQIIITSWTIPSTLKAKRSTEELSKVKEMCESTLDVENAEDQKMYFHGLLREFYGPTHPLKRMSLLCYLVRIYARLLASQRSNEFFRVQGDEKCSELFHSINENLCRFSFARDKFIYCAKYYAASEQYSDALKCYDAYFDTETSCNYTRKGESWAAYNYSKTVFCGKLFEEYDKAIDKCKIILDSNKITVPYGLLKKLKDILHSLETTKVE